MPRPEKIRGIIVEKISDRRLKQLHELEERLGIKFTNIELLELALTHTSYVNESRKQIESNERLEFLGDAVLELATSNFLYNRFPNMPEGALTKTRTNIVRGTSLASVSKKLKLGEMLLLGRGEEESGGRTRLSNLEDVFEAVLGAVYLDQGWEVARSYVFRHMKQTLDEVREGEVAKDHKSALQEIVQQTPGRKIEYVELDSYGPDHSRSFEFAVKIDGKIYGRGIGKSKKEAEQFAAREAIQKLAP